MVKEPNSPKERKMWVNIIWWRWDESSGQCAVVGREWHMLGTWITWQRSPWRTPLFCLLLEGGQQPGGGDRRTHSSRWDV